MVEDSIRKKQTSSKQEQSGVGVACKKPGPDLGSQASLLMSWLRGLPTPAPLTLATTMNTWVLMVKHGHADLTMKSVMNSTYPIESRTIFVFMTDNNDINRADKYMLLEDIKALRRLFLAADAERRSSYFVSTMNGKARLLGYRSTKPSRILTAGTVRGWMPCETVIAGRLETIERVGLR